MSVRVLLVSGRAEIEESLREDPGANAYWVERRPPDLVVPAEVTREFAIAIVDFDSCPDGLAMARSLRANKAIEVISVAGGEKERLAVESLRSGIFDYVLWPPQGGPSALWEMLASCIRKVKPAEPEFPVAFGRYTLLSRLGIGGMAEVFLADTGTPPRKIVVKRMLQSLAGDEFVAMFMDEARISSMLVHPNIVRVSDFGRVDDNLYIAMEYVPGQNLEQLRLALAGPFPPAIACYIVAEMCAGLGHAHGKADAAGAPQGIVHRDVNPPNVLIADDGRVMITDFGIAKAAHRYYETSSGTLKGKFEYMSPEQANGKVVDRRADLFCAGLVLFELLTGTRPFMADTPIETLFLIQECKPVAPSYWNQRLPKMLDDICAKALAKDPADRYSDAAEMERDLREFARSSMNPGPRDLSVFTKSVGRGFTADAKAPVPVALSVTIPPAAAVSDGKVTALLQRKKRLDEARTGEGPAAAVPFVEARAAQPSAKLSPLVAELLADETPARPTPVPKLAAVALPVEPRPPARPDVSPAQAASPVVPSPAAIAPAVAAVPPAAAAAAAATAPVSAGPPLAPPPAAVGPKAPVGVDVKERRRDRSRSTPQPGGAGATVEVADDEPEPGAVLELDLRDRPVAAPPWAAPSEPRMPERTASAEMLFPSSAKTQERTRRIQFGAAVGGGVFLAIVFAAFVGPRVGALLASPTPYPSPTLLSMVSQTPVPSETPAIENPSPIPSTTLVVRVSPSPVPSRTAMALTSPTASPVRTAVAKGTLSIWVDGWATVEIDGRPAGNAPFVAVPLPAGKHRLVLVNGAKMRKEVEVVVQPGKDAKYTVVFP